MVFARSEKIGQEGTRNYVTFQKIQIFITVLNEKQV